jgi:hypothetical protein
MKHGIFLGDITYAFIKALVVIKIPRLAVSLFGIW